MAKGQIKAGDRDGGRASISAALQTADLLRNDPFREEALLHQDVADAQMLADDIRGAHDSLVRARGLTKDNVLLGYIAVEEASIGDASEAKTTLELISDAGTRSRFGNEIEHLHGEKRLRTPLPSDLVTAPSVANAEAGLFFSTRNSSPVLHFFLRIIRTSRPWPQKF